VDSLVIRLWCHCVIHPAVMPNLLWKYDRKIGFTGIVLFTIRWWNPQTFAAMHPEGRAARVTWPYVEDKSYLWTWLFVVPLAAYSLWQLMYYLIVNVLRRQRLLRDPEVMTSYRYIFCIPWSGILYTYGIWSRLLHVHSYPCIPNSYWHWMNSVDLKKC
jgi:hypothetical protein